MRNSVNCELVSNSVLTFTSFFSWEFFDIFCYSNRKRNTELDLEDKQRRVQCLWKSRTCIWKRMVIAHWFTNAEILNAANSLLGYLKSETYHIKTTDLPFIQKKSIKLLELLLNRSSVPRKTSFVLVSGLLFKCLIAEEGWS